MYHKRDTAIIQYTRQKCMCVYLFCGCCRCRSSSSSFRLVAFFFVFSSVVCISNSSCCTCDRYRPKKKTCISNERRKQIVINTSSAVRIVVGAIRFTHQKFSDIQMHYLADCFLVDGLYRVNCEHQNMQLNSPMK